MPATLALEHPTEPRLTLVRPAVTEVQNFPEREISATDMTSTTDTTIVVLVVSVVLVAYLTVFCEKNRMSNSV